MNPNWINDFIVERNVKQKQAYDKDGAALPTYYAENMPLYFLQASNGAKVMVNEPTLKAIQQSEDAFNLFNDRKADVVDVVFFVEDNFKELLDIRSVA